MNIYIFLGSHLPEVLRCMVNLAQLQEDTRVVDIYLPPGIDPPQENTAKVRCHAYNPLEPDWDFDPGSDALVFILVDPRLSPVPQMEGLANHLQSRELEPVKIITCVDCATAEGSPQLRTYLDTCVYYSDIVLLGNRSGASKAFVRKFESEYVRKCYPCVFGLLKGEGDPDDPFEILVPGTRRLAQEFDLGEEPEPAAEFSNVEASYNLEEEEDADPEPPGHPASGVHPVPDISPFIVWKAANSPD